MGTIGGVGYSYRIAELERQKSDLVNKLAEKRVSIEELQEKYWITIQILVVSMFINLYFMVR